MFMNNQPSDLNGSGDASGVQKRSNDYNNAKSKKSNSTTRLKRPPMLKTKAEKRDRTPLKRRSLSISDFSPIAAKISTPLKDKFLQSIQKTTELKDMPDQDETKEILGYYFKAFLHFMWKQRNKKIAALKEKIVDLEDQVSQLKREINCLQTLQQNESIRRTEAVMDLQSQKDTIDDLTDELNQTKQELEFRENESIIMEQRIQIITVDLENMKNQCNGLNVENGDHLMKIHYLEDENKMLRSEEQILRHKVSALETETSELQQIVEKIRKTSNELIQKTQEQMAIVARETKLKNDTIDKLNAMHSKQKQLKAYIKEKDKNEKDLTVRIWKIEQSLEESESMIKHLNLEKHELNQKLMDVQTKLKTLENKKWTAVVMDAMKPSVHILHKFMLLMFPAIPRDVITFKDQQAYMRKLEQLNSEVHKRDWMM